MTSRFNESYLINSSLIKVVTWSLDFGSRWAISVAIASVTCCWISWRGSSSGLVSWGTGVDIVAGWAAEGRVTWGCPNDEVERRVDCLACNSWRRIKLRILSLSWRTVCLAWKISDFSGNEGPEGRTIIGVGVNNECVSAEDGFDTFCLTGFDCVDNFIWLGIINLESSWAMMVSSLRIGIIKPCFFP